MNVCCMYIHTYVPKMSKCKCTDELIFLLMLSVKGVYSANILYVAAVASPSHHIWNRALAFGLVTKGHNVTHIGPDEDSLPKPQNYSHILTEGLYEEMHESFDINAMALYGPWRMLWEFQEMCIYQCQLLLRSDGLRKLLNYPPDFKFDLIIFDVTAGACLYPLIQRFNYPPTVGVTAFLLPPYVSYDFGNNLFPAYIPWYGLPYSTEMSFFERVWNYIYTNIDANIRHLYLYNKDQEEAKKIFGENTPPMTEFIRHISLILANTDPILDYPQPIPPNIIPVGGLHTRKSKDIPQEFKKILDNAKNGVILFSLGTNIRSDKLDQKTQKALLEAFSKIKQTVIWKFESPIENLPKNVIVRQWLPQNDILGHPNVKLFIGHGGALSTQEAIFHGVPMIAIPFIVDQYINARLIVNKRLGVSVDFQQITTEYFLSKLKEVLETPLYSQNMKKMSSIFNDRAETPLERGIFWIEYVLRHGNVDFLNTPAKTFPFYKSLGLDVLAFLLTLGFVFIWILYKIVQIISNLVGVKKKVKLS